MVFFFDTSALVKRYVAEIGSEKVDDLLTTASQVIVSPITKIEIYSTICRLKSENALSTEDYSRLHKAIQYDFRFFNVVSLNQEIESQSIYLVEKYHLRTLDSVQLASCLSRKDFVDSFVVSDKRLKHAAKNEKLDLIDPTES